MQRDASETWQVVASRNHPSPELGGFLERLGSYECVSVGSSLKMCLVADGSAHIYPRFGPTMLWDTAAAEAIVRAAGGHWHWLDPEVRDYRRENLVNPGFIVSSTPNIPV